MAEVPGSVVFQVHTGDKTQSPDSLGDGLGDEQERSAPHIPALREAGSNARYGGVLATGGGHGVHDAGPPSPRKGSGCNGRDEPTSEEFGIPRTWGPLVHVSTIMNSSKQKTEG